MLLVVSSPVDEDPGDTVVVPGSVDVDDVAGVVVEDVSGGPEVELPPVVPPVSSVSTAESQAGRRSRVAAPSATRMEEEFWKAMVKPTRNGGGYGLEWPEWDEPVTGRRFFLPRRDSASRRFRENVDGDQFPVESAFRVRVDKVHEERGDIELVARNRPRRSVNDRGVFIARRDPDAQ